METYAHYRRKKECERERERDRQTDRQTVGETEKTDLESVRRGAKWERLQVHFSLFLSLSLHIYVYI